MQIVKVNRSTQCHSHTVYTVERFEFQCEHRFELRFRHNWMWRGLERWGHDAWQDAVANQGTTVLQ